MSGNIKPDVAVRKSGRVTNNSCHQGDLAGKRVGHDQDATSVMGRLVSQEILRARRENAGTGSTDRLSALGDAQFPAPSDDVIDVIFERMSGFLAVA
jgi:hypothetical protein